MNNIDTNLTLETFPNGILLYQGENFYKFTKDAIDLAKFCSIKRTDNVLELCAGSGVVSFYAYSLKPFNKMYLNELQPGLCDIIKKNIELNKLQNKAVCLEGDLSNLADKDFDKKLDVIICNPPYFKSEKKINLEYSKAVARHEIATNLSTIIKKAKQFIKVGGKFYLANIPSRTAETIIELNKNKFECKKIKFIYNKSSVNLVLFEAVYMGKSGVQIILENI